MAIAFVKAATNSTGSVTSATVTFGSATAAASVIVVSIGTSVTTVTVTSITQTGSAGGTFVARKAPTNGLPHEVWWLTGGTGTVLTLNFSAATGVTVVATEFSGVATASPVDGTPATNELTGTGALPLPTSGTVTPAAAGALVIASCSDDGVATAPTWTHSDAGGTYTAAGSIHGSNTQNHVQYYLIQTAATATSCAITSSSATSTTSKDGVIAIFKAAAAASTFPPLPAVWHNPTIPQ